MLFGGSGGSGSGGSVVGSHVDCGVGSGMVGGSDVVVPGVPMSFPGLVPGDSGDCGAGSHCGSHGRFGGSSSVGSVVEFTGCCPGFLPSWAWAYFYSFFISWLPYLSQAHCPLSQPRQVVSNRSQLLTSRTYKHQMVPHGMMKTEVIGGLEERC